MEETGWFQGEFEMMHYDIARRFVEICYAKDPETTRAIFEQAGLDVLEGIINELMEEGTLEAWGVDEEGEILFGLTEEGEALAAQYENGHLDI
jgi:hypothetical protein